MGTGSSLRSRGFVVSLAPVLGFVDMSFLLFSRTADHLQYIALLAFIPIAVVAVVFAFRSARLSISPVAAKAAAVAVLAFCFVLT